MRRGLGSLVALAAVGAGAQMHVVKKPDTVVRAVGVYEWTGDVAKPTASRLVPVTLFIDGKLEDAGVYLARPVPFALDTGTIFELDRAGVAEGTVDLSFARHISAEGGDFDDGWMGFGPYKPLAKPVVSAKAKKSGPLSKIEVSGGKADSGGPKFSNKPAASGDKTASTTTPDDPDRPTMKRRDDSASANADSGKASTTAAADDPDRPTMKRKTDADSTDTDAKTADPKDKDSTAQAGDKTDSTKTDSSDPDDKAERPTLRRRSEPERQAARKQHDTSSVTGVGSLNDDPDRPNLHRGKSAGNMNEDDLPALVGLPAEMQQRVAVSDAANRAPHDFTRAWKDEAERATVLGKMQAVAREKLAAYERAGSVAGSGELAAVAGAPAAPAALPAKSGGAVGSTPAARAAARRKAAAAAKAAGSGAIELKDEELKAYTLSYGGAATYFYSAMETPADGVARYVSLVAQQEDMGELRTAMASVTDAKHLDRTPQMRLVDVVDAEASNRASLLMDLRGQRSRQFALYRVIGAEAQQTFVGGTTE